MAKRRTFQYCPRTTSEGAPSPTCAGLSSKEDAYTRASIRRAKGEAIVMWRAKCTAVPLAWEPIEEENNTKPKDGAEIYFRSLAGRSKEFARLLRKSTAEERKA